MQDMPNINAPALHTQIIDSHTSFVANKDLAEGLEPSASPFDAIRC